MIMLFEYREINDEDIIELCDLVKKYGCDKIKQIV